MVKQEQRRSTFVGREHEAPTPTLARTRHHELTPGVVCEHISVPDEKWVVRAAYGFWCQAAKGHGKDVIVQMFPCDALLPVIDVKRTKAGVIVKTRTKADVVKDEFAKAARVPPVPRNDDVTKQLAEAKTIDQLWELACRHGLPADLRDKLSHLNPGLQRMNIGNRLRAMHQKGAAAVAEMAPPTPPAPPKRQRTARRGVSKPS